MAKRTNRQIMRMVFYCAKVCQEHAVHAQVEDSERKREQRDLNEICRLEKLILGDSQSVHKSLGECKSLSIAEIIESLDTPNTRNKPRV